MLELAEVLKYHRVQIALPGREFEKQFKFNHWRSLEMLQFDQIASDALHAYIM